MKTVLIVVAVAALGGAASPASAVEPDADGDGYTADVDCDDNDAALSPGVTEVYGNGLDDNCDGYADTSDYGNVGECSPGSGREATGAVYPRPEVLDWIDNDCNGLVDDLPDTDGDGVLDADDRCPGTVLPDQPTVGLTGARFAAQADGTFDSGVDGFDGVFTLDDTAGCSGTQIIAAQGLGAGHTKFGVSRSALEAFVASLWTTSVDPVRPAAGPRPTPQRVDPVRGGHGCPVGWFGRSSPLIERPLPRAWSAWVCAAGSAGRGPGGSREGFRFGR